MRGIEDLILIVVFVFMLFATYDYFLASNNEREYVKCVADIKMPLGDCYKKHMKGK